MGLIKIELTGREFYLIKEALAMAEGGFNTVPEDREAMTLLDELKNIG